MNTKVRCAIYTRKSTEDGLEQDFNSLDAQREACEAYIHSQRGLGWRTISTRYDDGGISGGTLERPALRALLADVEDGKVDLIVVYKVDRLTRSLSDFSRIIETLDASEVSFVSVTQQFNTANSMGRLTLNMLLSFAQFEREVTAERIRDKIAASKRKGMWMGGLPPLGYDVEEKKLIMNEREARIVRDLFDNYLRLKSVRKLKVVADERGWTTKKRVRGEKVTGDKPLTRGHLYYLLRNPLYVGEVSHKGKTYPGQHDAIIDRENWDKTQRFLSDQAPKRRSKLNEDRRCILAGLVIDETGDPLCPTYAKKEGRVHSYYVSKRLLQPACAESRGWRLPAHALENAVVSSLAAILRDERRWFKLLLNGDLTADEIQHAHNTASVKLGQLNEGDPKKVRDIIRGLVHQIRIEPGNLTIVCSAGALVSDEQINEGAPGYRHSMPFQLRRRGVEARIILGGEVCNERNFDPNLIAALRRSFRWWKRLTEEKGWSIQKLASHDGIDASDVTRFLPLVFLPPEIVRMIMEGRQPIDLNLERFKKMGPLPLDWAEQERVLSCSEIGSR